MKIRLDQFLVNNNFFDSREKAKREIMAGNILVNEEKQEKSGFQVNEDVIIRIKEKLKFVSRGGLKLEKAIKHFNLDLKNKIILDIGSSTGGFTDCALQNGAEKVYSVDVGYNQLDFKLRNDKRVKSLEKMHIKNLEKKDLEFNLMDFIVIDVSFISLLKVFPYIEKFEGENSVIIALIKPQFEVGKDNVGKNGIVRDKNLHNLVIDKIKKEVEKNYKILEVIESPILGRKGNKEYLIGFSSGTYY